MSGFLAKAESRAGGVVPRQIIEVDQNVGDIVWSRDGHTIAVAIGNAIRIVHARTGDTLRTLPSKVRSTNLAWSADSKYLISLSDDQKPQLWVPGDRQIARRPIREAVGATAISWHPSRATLAIGHDNGTVRMWDAATGQLKKLHRPRRGYVTALAWSPDGERMASGTQDGTILIWAAQSGAITNSPGSQERTITTLAWTSNSRILIAGCVDGTVRTWDTADGRLTHILEAHSTAVSQVMLLPGDEILLSRSSDGVCRLWQLQTMNQFAEERHVHSAVALGGTPLGVAYTLDDRPSQISIWDLNTDILLGRPSSPTNVHYRNAKVVIIGDTGSGKSGLSLVMTGSPFAATDSTHGRHVWTLFKEDVDAIDGGQETHEILLWDLAGQPSYRLIHQLHLNEIEVALICFDSRSDTDPFAGVHYWAKAIRLAEHIQGGTARPLRKYLVSSRIDRGGIPVSADRVSIMIERLSLDGYFETSAKEGWGIDELLQTVIGSIDWLALPKVTSTELLQDMKSFLLTQKESGHVLVKLDDLVGRFRQAHPARATAEDFRQQFEACIGRVEARGLIRRLSFGNFVLLQPEYIDAYASAIVNVARAEPDGLGSIFEEIVLTGKFAMPESERLRSRTHERVLLLATVHDLIQHEVAIREMNDGRPELIFPSQLTRENPDFPDLPGRSVMIKFEGPTQNIYTTLVVRISHTAIFGRSELWRNSVTFRGLDGDTCGLALREFDGGAELTIYFDGPTSSEIKQRFEEYVQTHVAARAIPGSVSIRRVFVCSNCGEALTDSQVKKRISLGAQTIACPVCEHVVPLQNYDGATQTNESAVAELDQSADAVTRRQTANAVVEGKRLTLDFDVFLCHNSSDKAQVRAIGEELRTFGVLPWFDEWELRPGLPWTKILEQHMSQIKAAAVFVGNEGVGPWQRQEIDAFLREFVARSLPVIPVLLDTATAKPDLPLFLRAFTWVDFRSDPQPMNRLMWGITGERHPVA